jgi:hypothetical protein
LQLNRTAKISFTLLVISAIIWLGGINVRFLIGNQLLNYDEFNFRTSIPPDEENLIFKMISDSSLLIMCAYVLVFISAIVFLRSCKINIKENPWLLMNAILFFVFSPVEFYTYYLDIKFILLFLSNPPDHDELLKIFGERIGFLRGVPWIAVMSYYAIIAISIFQPLKKSGEEIEAMKSRIKENSYKYTFHEDDDLIIHESKEN